MTPNTTIVSEGPSNDRLDGENDLHNEQDDVIDRISYPDVYSAWKSTATCDRRLSRAARSLLRQKILQDVFFDENAKHDIGNQNDVWALLDRWLLMRNPGNAQSPSQSCPLWPSRDVYREEEAHVVPVHVQSLAEGSSHAMKAAVPNHLVKHRRSSSPNRPYRWFRCTYCGKMFLTLFYLDLHMSRSHQGREPHDNIDAGTGLDHETSPIPGRTMSSKFSKICPAVDWCKLVGLANCHEKAFLDEPYYDRGSGGWGEDDRTYVQHRWSKISQSIPCSIKRLQEDCRSILRACGLMDDPTHDDWTSEVPPKSPSLHAHHMAESFCQQLTCPRHRTLWHFFDDDKSTSHASHANFHEQWKDIWTQEVQHHRLIASFFGTVVVVGLLVWVLHAVATAKGWRWQRRDTIPAGQRLLYKGQKRHFWLQSRRRGRGIGIKQD